MQPGILIRTISFIWPVILKKFSSEFNPVLEVTLYRNKLQLNSKRANYSFGSLHRVMKKAIALAVKEYEINPGNALILGYGGGSAAQILRKYFPAIDITAVEIDPAVVAISKEWFDNYNAKIQIQDARVLLLTGTEEKYDLIICDIFQDLTTPAWFLSEEFYRLAASCLTSEGILIQNLMISPIESVKQLGLMQKWFENSQFFRAEDSNRIYMGRKRD